MNEKALYSLTYGLFVLTAKAGSFDNGCIINTAIQAASNPNTITVAVNKANHTTDMIRETGKFNVSVLGENADFSVFQRFGFQSGRDCNKFEGYSNVSRGSNGLLYITDVANAYFCCTVRDTIDLGSHYMFVGTVDDCDVINESPSMTYAYYFANVKPKPQQPKSEGRVWVCKICGYTYDEKATGTKFEDLPEDWVCPLCKHPKSDFVLQ
ncbi:MAG: flavin reductase [Clostridia bacterium]|nr:flavin reductase [Clostridia bacterium]